MKFNLFTIIGIVGLFFFSLPFRVFATTEYNPDAIHVDTLPVCEQSVANNVYALSTDNHYYKCNLISGGLRNIQVGDNLQGKTVYFSFPETQEFADLLVNYVSDNAITFGNISSSQGWSDTLYIRVMSNNRIAIRDGTSVIYFNTIYENAARVIDDFTFQLPMGSITYGNFTISSINVNNPAYQYIKISSGSDVYEYEDQGEIPVLYTYEDKDFYLFYDLGMIANLDIFNNYDFTSFTDYQKVVVVIGFNVFYIAILCFFGAVIYKTIARLIRFILG